MKTVSELMKSATERHGLDRPLIRVFFDGACEPRNPGGVATSGWIVYGVDDEVLGEGADVCGEGPGWTNNVAEYYALGKSLRFLVEHRETIAGATVRIFGDSQLVCEQVAGTWKCNKEHLRKLRDRCRELIEQLRVTNEVEIRWVPREENEAADALSRKAYEKHTGRDFPERRKRA